MKKLRDFKCKKCGFIFEKLSDKTLFETCPRCGNNDTEFMFAPQAIKVTGQGAYTNRMKVRNANR